MISCQQSYSHEGRSQNIQIALILHQQGKYNESIKEYTKVIEVNFQYPQIKEMLIRN
ncbi:unnamed protein product [Paramecium sonneborni]|uniref:Tetratricopeptide repeat protein n=1 Tax=Paramecium sonneborni TaxID=65129 RepID=A0A8S1PFB4_9CILI|nr:unnamed protein product [Paramecium sonneborni]